MASRKTRNRNPEMVNQESAQGAAVPSRGWSPRRIRNFLVQRFYTRFHMSLILASSGLAAMIASWGLLHAGVHSMLARYPVAITAAYLTFLLGIWAWLKYVGIGGGTQGSGSSLREIDIPNLGGSSGGGGGGGSGGVSLPRGGGGTFDGGGAGASWAEGGTPGVLPANLQTQALAAVSAPDSPAGGGSGGGLFKEMGSLGDLGDGDGFVIVLAIALVGAIFLASGYLIVFAPDILGEAAFGALLAGGLSRPSQHHDATGWVAGVARKTWWPFAIVLVMAMVFAWYAGKHYPGAHTFREAVSMATSQ